MASEVGDFLTRLTARAATDKSLYDDVEYTPPPAGVAAKACPGCGAGRAKSDGLTRCAYCGHEFMTRALTDGVYLSSDDNSE